MSKKRKKMKKVAVTLKARSAMDQMVQEKMADGFILRNTIDLKDFKKDILAHQLVLDGHKSAEPSALALTIIVNSVIAHGRIHFVLTKDDFTKMMKYDQGLRKSCSRRKRESVIKDVPYAMFRALMYKSGYFKHVADVMTKDGNEVKILEAIHPILLEYLVLSGRNSATQLAEIHEFYDRSRKRETERIAGDQRNAERAAAIKKSNEEKDELRKRNRRTQPSH